MRGSPAPRKISRPIASKESSKMSKNYCGAAVLLLLLWLSALVKYSYQVPFETVERYLSAAVPCQGTVNFDLCC